jgi:hypothetical protein
MPVEAPAQQPQPQPVKITIQSDALLKLMDAHKSAVCAIPLLEVPAKDTHDAIHAPVPAPGYDAQGGNHGVAGGIHAPVRGAVPLRQVTPPAPPCDDKK